MRILSCRLESIFFDLLTDSTTSQILISVLNFQGIRDLKTYHDIVRVLFFLAQPNFSGNG